MVDENLDEDEVAHKIKQNIQGSEYIQLQKYPTFFPENDQKIISQLCLILSHVN